MLVVFSVVDNFLPSIKSDLNITSLVQLFAKELDCSHSSLLGSINFLRKNGVICAGGYKSNRKPISLTKVGKALHVKNLELKPRVRFRVFEHAQEPEHALYFGVWFLTSSNRRRT